MKEQKHLLLFAALFLFLSCKKDKIHLLIPAQTDIVNRVHNLTEVEKKSWHLKDIELDTIPGISLQRAYDSLLVGKKGKEVIIAVLDTKLDIHHEDLKKQLWVNKKEIPNNNIDDDNNGYIDDIHGWNFLGNSDGEDLLYQKYSCLRIVEKYEPYFKGKQMKDINTNDSILFLKYNNAKEELNRRLKNKKADFVYADMLLKSLADREKALLAYFPKGKYNLSDLDSLKKVHLKNKDLQRDILIRSNFMKWGYTQEFMDLNKTGVIAKYGKMLNSLYDERNIVGDNYNDLDDAFYGNGILFGDVPFRHSIGVSGLFGAQRGNKKGIEGVSNYIKIMPIVMVASGDEYDKDVALAIRYAVDNGAEIINMSWGKNFSVHSDWVNEAMKYAESKDVLLITAAGNDGSNNDNKKSYPDDNEKGNEFLTNFISVGATGYDINDKLKTSFSNYGKENVDIYAPGSSLYTTATKNTYQFGSGTSYASPIVAGVAALIKSYYPGLTAIQVKKIILESGVSYDLDINIGSRKKKELVPFSNLSKSGRVVNAYNALIMAEKVVNE
jgi:subtilisin family serine protease